MFVLFCFIHCATSRGVKNPSLPSCFIGTPDEYFSLHLSHPENVFSITFSSKKRRQQYVLCVYAENSPFCCLTNLCFTYVRYTEKKQRKKKKKHFPQYLLDVGLFFFLCFVSLSIHFSFFWVPWRISVCIYFHFIIFSIKSVMRSKNFVREISTDTHKKCSQQCKCT